MKNKLLATVPVVALAFALSAPAGAVKLKIGGFIDKHFGFGTNDDAYESGQANREIKWDVKDDSEIQFTASGKLNNGLSVKGRMELEGGHHLSSDPVDETWLSISGSFGQIILGTHDLPAARLNKPQEGSLNGAGPALEYNIGNWISKPSTVSTEGSAHADTSSDGDGISYISPRVNGVQFGVGYAAMATQDSNSKAVASGDHDHLSLGVNYSTKTAGMKVVVGAGVAKAKSAGLSDGDDPFEHVYGVKVTSGAIEVAASYFERDDRSTSSATDAAAGSEVYEFGVRYTMGGNKFAFVMSDATNNSSNNTAAKDDKSREYGLSMSRSLGKGATWHASYFLSDHDNGASGAASSTSNSGYAVVTGVKIKF
tara:strand:+ start:182 stop:1288 length:1107 start_codon:yes stop_codon:yes gene_type:complete